MAREPRVSIIIAAKDAATRVFDQLVGWWIEAAQKGWRLPNIDRVDQHDVGGGAEMCRRPSSRGDGRLTQTDTDDDRG